MSPDEQIIRASNISIAKVLRATRTADGTTEYEFIVQRRLTGPDELFFKVIGFGAPQNDTSFNSHADLSFWQRGGGRLSNDTACVIHPTFVVGNSYIAFIDSPFTRRSFEKIETPMVVIHRSETARAEARKVTT